MNTTLAKHYLRNQSQIKYGPWMCCHHCGAPYFTLWLLHFHINHYCRKA